MRKILLAVLLLLPLLASAQTVNYFPALGGSFNSSLLAPAANNCTTIPYSFTGDSNTGLCTSAADTFNLYTNGSSRLSGNSTTITGTVPYTGTSTGNSITLCNTADCTTNYETGVMTWDSNYFDIKTAKGGSGSARTLRLYSQGNAAIQTSSIQPLVTSSLTLGAYNLLWTNAYVNTAVQGFRSKTITDAGATGFVQIALVQTVGSNFNSGKIVWQVHCDNGTATTYADRAGETVFSCNNISGTEACVFDSTAQQVTQAATYSLAAPTFTATGGTDTVTLNVNADCAGVSGPTNMYIHYRLETLGVQAIAPL